MVIDWESTAFPVLRALHESDAQAVRDGFLNLGHGGGRAALGIDVEDDVLHDALLSLRDAGMVHIDSIEYAGGGSASVVGTRVTGRGLQALGQWPRFHAIATPEAIASILDELRKYAPDEAVEKDISRAAETARRATPTVLREAVTTFTAGLIRAKVGM